MSAATSSGWACCRSWEHLLVLTKIGAFDEGELLGERRVDPGRRDRVHPTPRRLNSTAMARVMSETPPFDAQ